MITKQNIKNNIDYMVTPQTIKNNIYTVCLHHKTLKIIYRLITKQNIKNNI
jgi:hypothetical protein